MMADMNTRHDGTDMHKTTPRTDERPRYRLAAAVVVLVALAACGGEARKATLARGPVVPEVTTTTTTAPEPTTTTTAPTTVAERRPVTRLTEPEPTTVKPRPSTTTTTARVVEPAAGQPVATSHGGPVQDHVSLVDNLRARGLTVTPESSLPKQPFLRGDGTVLAISGAGIAATRIQSFEYDSTAAAAADAATFGPDGSPRGTSIMWIGPPHLYQRGRVLVIYVGADPSVTALLTDLLGPQFSGR